LRELPSETLKIQQLTQELFKFAEKVFGDRLIYETDVIESTAIYGYQEMKRYHRLSLLIPDQQALMRHLGKFTWNSIITSVNLSSSLRSST
jgi:hypothetical protein